MKEQRNRDQMAELSRLADQVCFLILTPEYPDVDVRIAQEEVRRRCEELFPERMDLYGMVYESRFNRLWDQFRHDPAFAMDPVEWDKGTGSDQ